MARASWWWLHIRRFSQFLVFKVKSQFIGRNVQRTPGTSAGVGRLGEITGEPREGQIYGKKLSLHDECTWLSYRFPKNINEK